MVMRGKNGIERKGILLFHFHILDPTVLIRVGRHEMTSLATSWTNMKSDEFVTIKSRLEV